MTKLRAPIHWDVFRDQNLILAVGAVWILRLPSRRPDSGTELNIAIWSAHRILDDAPFLFAGFWLAWGIVHGCLGILRLPRAVPAPHQRCEGRQTCADDANKGLHARPYKDLAHRPCKICSLDKLIHRDNTDYAGHANAVSVRLAPCSKRRRGRAGSTYKPPRHKIPHTKNFWLRGICSFHTLARSAS